MQSPHYPAPLKPGDKVALTAPGSPVTEDKLECAVNSLKFLELKPVIMKSCYNSYGYLAGPDLQRAADINTAFADKSVKAVFCLRGGYGSPRLLPYLDFDTIREHPKVLAGYSDITILLNCITQQCGFVTFHAPMPSEDYTTLDTFTLQSLKHALFSSPHTYTLHNPKNSPLKILYPGHAKGILAGGNLSLLVSTLGSPYEIDTKGKILFIEEVNEQPYKIDRMLTTLSIAGKFRDCKGIIFGTFSQCFRLDKKNNCNNTLSFQEILTETVLPFKKPTVTNLQAGHIFPQMTLPIGACISLDLTAYSANISVL